MITTNKLITVDDIPSYWVFETYCNLSEKLTGQNIKIKSVFNPSERTPSFALFVKDNQYRFNDFSSGKYGSKINFIMYLYNMSFPQAVNKLISDYTNYLYHNSLDDIRSFKKQAKYKIS